VRRRSALAALAAAGLLTAAPVAGAAEPLRVTGFQSQGASPALIGASAPALTTVGVDGVNLDLFGDAVEPPDRQALRQLRAAHAEHLRAELLIGNHDNVSEGFSERIANRMLTTPRIRARVAGMLVADVRDEGWDGISVDLESLRPRDSRGLTAFLHALRSALPSTATLSVEVANDVTAAGFRAGGYDLRALATAAGRIVLMAYDQHGPWENAPGPVGALDWTRRGLRTLLHLVPPDRVDLGVAGYGYAWRPHRDVQLSDSGARALVARAHARPHWVGSVGEWTATLPDGSTVWWSDARSYTVRARLAASLHLHGLAVWSLGLSDPIR
jgi:spore germination protein